MIPTTIKREKPIPRSRRKSFKPTRDIRFSDLPSRENRAAQIRRSNDTFRGVYVGLKDIDESVLYYFDNVIKPTVTENNEIINVPIRYGSSELWKFIQKDGYLKDSKGKIISPLIIFRRTNISKDDSVSIDKLNRNIVHQFPIKWSSKNQYDRFSLLNGGLEPTYEVYNMVVPDYITIDYECVILTSFVSQMNGIIEKIFYNEGQYWGDPDKFKFSTRIDSFDQNIDVSTDKGRLVRSNFNLQMRGFLVPEYFGDYASVDKKYTVQKVVIGAETEIPVDDIFRKLGIRDYRIENDIYTTDVPTKANENEILIYLLKEKWKKATGITTNLDGESVITFENTIVATPPFPLNNTTKYDFLFFANGFYMEHDAIRVEQSGNTFIVYSNTSNIGYQLDDSDEVLAWGYFE